MINNSPPPQVDSQNKEPNATAFAPTHVSYESVHQGAVTSFGSGVGFLASDGRIHTPTATESQTAPPTPPAVPPFIFGAKARLQCHACSRLLEYDAGAQYVQCFSCSMMNIVLRDGRIGGRVLTMLCAVCQTTNLAPYGLGFVRCGTCRTVSEVTHAYHHPLAQSPVLAPLDQGSPYLCLQPDLSGSDSLEHLPLGHPPTEPLPFAAQASAPPLPPPPGADSQTMPESPTETPDGAEGQPRDTTSDDSNELPPQN